MKTWSQRIAAAQLRGTFTRADKFAAGRWPECAVGERFKTTCAVECPSPIIEKLGYLFEDAVVNDRVAQAGSLLASIEAEAIEEKAVKL